MDKLTDEKKVPNREDVMADREKIRAKYTPAVAERYDEACERDEEGNFGANIVMLDEMEDAMVGTTVNEHGIVVPVYEEELCVKSLAEKFLKSGEYKDYDEAYTAAAEWFDYNTLRAIPYLKEQAPIIIRAFDRDTELWEGFLDVKPSC